MICVHNKRVRYAVGLHAAVAYPGIFFRGGSTNSVEDRGNGVPRIFFSGGGGSTNSVEDRRNGDLAAIAP